MAGGARRREQVVAGDVEGFGEADDGVGRRGDVAVLIVADLAGVGANLGGELALGLGLFESDIVAIARAIHEVEGLLYYDGANFNAILGEVRPGDMGFDIVHLNLHKTFATPHGGGGPGAGPVAVSARLAPFLPGLRLVWTPEG